MKIEFTPVDHHLYEITISDADLDWTALHNDLKEMTWQMEPPADGNLGMAVYHAKNSIETPRVKQFREWFLTTEFKNQLVDMLFTNQNFTSKFPALVQDWDPSLYAHLNELYPKMVRQQTMIASHWIMTPPKYVDHTLHTDVHTPYAFGMIYIIPDDDPMQSTYFTYSDHVINSSNVLKIKTEQLRRIPTGFGRGWLVINGDQSYHKALNNTDLKRYSLKIALNSAGG
jgi:hypothetical protein